MTARARSELPAIEPRPMNIVDAMAAERRDRTRAIWDAARDSAYANGFGAEFDQLCAENEELQRALATAADQEKMPLLRRIQSVAHRRATLVLPPSTHGTV